MQRVKGNEESPEFKFSVKFKIFDIDDEEIVKLVKFSSMVIDLNPSHCGIISYQWRPITISMKNWIFNLHPDNNGLLNFSELIDVEIDFVTQQERELYLNFVLKQFESEIQRLKSVSMNVSKEEIYEINVQEGIKKIYEGVEKTLDRNSQEYREIVEKNREAWKKLADL
ncbi:MAG: hypothetical protein ACHQJ4_01330 [Ignavibacteria bacterium]